MHSKALSATADEFLNASDLQAQLLRYRDSFLEPNTLRDVSSIAV